MSMVNSILRQFCGVPTVRMPGGGSTAECSVAVVLRSLWSVLGFLLKFITRLLYMSLVSCFMLFQIVNMPQVISISLLLNLIYFLWNAHRHILIL